LDWIMTERMGPAAARSPFRGALSLALALLAATCSSSQMPRQAVRPAPAVPAPSGIANFRLVPARFDDLPDWQSDQHAAALMALRRSCPTLTAVRPDLPYGGSELFGRVAHWQRMCAAADLVAPGDRAARAFFEEWFSPYMAFSGDTEWGLFTGYYEPLLRGSWSRSARFRVPLYRPPPETAAGLARADGRGVTLPSRAQIDAGALAGRGLELLWVDDPVGAYFLHVQGCGQVEMTDGSRVRVGFAAKNGHQYHSIGAELVRRGEVPQEQMSMQAIRAWLTAHPRDAPGLMARNGSYVFFRFVDGDGPIGAQGVPLLPGRSMAVDPGFVPYGVPVWLDTTDPLDKRIPLRRLVVAQDTGAAIKGPVRGDLFWGSGDAAAAAGLMKQQGRWFLLLPKAAAAAS
jgi:membrane-bound lytic murein transglycosylase A